MVDDFGTAEQADAAAMIEAAARLVELRSILSFSGSDSIRLGSMNRVRVIDRSYLSPESPLGDSYL